MFPPTTKLMPAVRTSAWVDAFWAGGIMGNETVDTFREERAANKRVRDDWIDKWISTKAAEEEREKAAEKGRGKR